MKKKKRMTYKRVSKKDKRECNHKWKLVAPYTWSCRKCHAYKDERSGTYWGAKSADE